MSAAQARRIMNGYGGASSHARRRLEADDLRDFLQARGRQTREWASGWASLLAAGMPMVRPETLVVLGVEVEAYVGELLRIELHSRGLIPTGGRGDCERGFLQSVGLDGPMRPGEISPGRLGVRGLHQDAVSCPPDSVVHHSAMMGAHSVPRPTVTREDFERFCRWTGMDPGCQVGTEAHRAALVFYLVVFTLLTDGGATPNLAGAGLLDRLRQCQEAVVRHVARMISPVGVVSPGRQLQMTEELITVLDPDRSLEGSHRDQATP